MSILTNSWKYINWPQWMSLDKAMVTLGETRITLDQLLSMDDSVLETVIKTTTLFLPVINRIADGFKNSIIEGEVKIDLLRKTVTFLDSFMLKKLDKDFVDRFIKNQRIKNRDPYLVASISFLAVSVVVTGANVLLKLKSKL